MFGLTIEKLIVIAVIAAVIIGPTRLPAYAAKLAQFVKTLRGMADAAKDRLSEELGPDFDDVDWKKLDPRQYDPRRIVRQALLDEDGPVVLRPAARAVAPAGAGVVAGAAGSATGADGADGAGRAEAAPDATAGEALAAATTRAVSPFERTYAGGDLSATGMFASDPVLEPVSEPDAGPARHHDAA